jgi:hypothetical protein
LGLSLLVLAGLLVPGPLRAQEQGTAIPSKTASKASTPESVPLGRYVPKENLVLYVEFAGLDAFEAGWKKTAAYRMLNETPLGVMLEEVSAQLLDKVASSFPNRKLGGAELVSLAKHAARSGWVLALHTPTKSAADTTPVRATFVLRGAAATKELRSLSARLMGLVMGNSRPKIEYKEGRPMVVVPASGTSGAPAASGASWAWWTEKNDLAVATDFPSNVDAIFATLAGKTGSALEHADIKKLFQPEGGFQPICVASALAANAPPSPSGFVGFLHHAQAEWGIPRIDLRAGFDGEALLAVCGVVAPKPRKGPATLFDQPAFDTTTLLPLPEGVVSFTELSVSPNQAIELLERLAPGDSIQAHIDEFAESIQRAGKVDLKKDLFAHLGPRIALFLAPGRSATTNDDSLASAAREGLSLTAVASVVQSLFPKLTLVAEVGNHAAFAAALEAAMIVVNKELKVQAVEAAQARTEAGGAGGNVGGRMATGRERPKRRRSLDQSPAPQFVLTPTATPLEVKTFVLTTPVNSPLKLGPSGFRPTVHLEGKYLALSLSPDAAQSALAAARRKGWKPAAEVERASEFVPRKLNVLSLIDVSKTLPPLLASFPGTLQTMINTASTVARSQSGSSSASASGPAGASGVARLGAAGGPVGGRFAGSRGRMAAGMGDQGDGVPGRPAPRGGSGGPDTAAPAGNAAPGSGSDEPIVLKVDADKLPKAEDLESRLFPSTLAINVTEQDLRLTWRGAFLDLALPIELAPLLASLPAVQKLRDRLQEMQTAAAAAPAAEGASSTSGTSDAAAQAPDAVAAPAAGKSAAPSSAPAGAGARGRRGRRSD